MRAVWDWEFLWNITPRLLDGLVVTVQATLLGISLALVLGLVLAMLRRSKVWLVSAPVGFFIEFVRSTPLLVQLFFLYFAMPAFGVSFDAFTTGVLGLGIHYAAYTSEVYRAGINGVQKGQWESSIALNLSMPTTWGSIILPQAVPPALPPLGNYVIAMFKDAPLLSAIAVVELLQQGRIICSETARCLEPYTLVGLMFLAVSIPASILVRMMEERLGRAKA